MCFSLNTNGVVHSGSSLFAASGVIHDGKGNWILGYNRYLEKCSVFAAELWGILDSSDLLQKQGYNGVIIQSDNLEAVVAINNSKLEGSNSTPVEWILKILSIEEKWCLKYVPKETNKITDALAKMTISNYEDLYMFEVPLMEIQEVLKEETIRINLLMNMLM
ncbi:hypothetical protein J1N35_035250 [Gossypium stocksii]|uniref:RNase H type-1 domain-containing protein n=1 Tax=Gossypium stocksii TaxID=47602 RepID=A0A9D3UU34_9ROSI|nr:hypothetical protein J1N35_035250 [Gossypium stocksii]